MAHKKYDLVQETSTFTGTGNIALGGAVARRRAFGSMLANGDTCHILIEHGSAAEWEICQASYVSAGNQLARSTVLASSTGSTVSFSAGTKTISMIPPAVRMLVEDDNGDVTVSRYLNVTASLLINGIGVMQRSGNYVQVFDSGGGANIQLGNATDPGNYYSNDTHNFYNRAQTTVFARMNSIGFAVGGISPSVARIESYAADGTYQLAVRGTTKGMRVNTTSTATVVEGVDTSLVASYQPLKINGSSVAIQESGVDVLICNIGAVRPGADNVTPLGHGSYRWTVVYAATGSINTSGRDAKVGIRAPSDAERRAAQRILAIGPKIYKFKDAVDAKGEGSRLHAGYIAEDVRDALEAEGLDPWRYGFMCADSVTVTETYTESVQRPVMQTVQTTETAVEVRDGQAVRVRRFVQREEPVGSFLPLFEEDGTPILSADGQPLVHFVPTMESVQETRTREVPLLDDAGQPIMRLGLRYSELEAFLKASS